MEFQDKVALISGGSSGIGLETGKLLAERGVQVWLLARNRERLQSALIEVEKMCRNPRQHCGTVVADVTDFAQVKDAVAEVTKKCGPPDIVVNSAGDVYPILFQNIDDIEVFHKLMKVNYLGTVHVTHACLQPMLKRGSGHIVNISSVYGFLGGYGYSAYCASKFAVRGFSDALRAELKPLGIYVSVVFPQNTDTPQLAAENQLKPPVVKFLDTTSTMTPQAVAKAIVRGIARRQYVIIPGGESRLLFWLTNLLGPGTYWIMDRTVAAAKRKVEQKREQ